MKLVEQITEHLFLLHVSGLLRDGYKRWYLFHGTFLLEFVPVACWMGSSPRFAPSGKLIGAGDAG